MKLNTIAATLLMLGSVAAFAQTAPAPGSAPAPNHRNITSHTNDAGETR